MARKRHRRRNPSRNQWIAIGVGSAIVLAGGTILIVRRRRGLSGTTDTGKQGTALPGGSRWTFKAELDMLCQHPQTLSAATQATLVNGVFVPALNRALAKLPPQPTLDQINAAILQVANSVTDQACQPVTPATRAMALTLANAAWQRTQSVSGQN